MPSAPARVVKGPGLEDLTREVAASEYADGLLEIAVGFLLLCLGTLWMGSPGLLPILAALAVLFGPAVITRVKRRITYPRIGYADYPIDTSIDGGGVLGFVVGGVTATAVVVTATGGIADVEAWRQWSGLLAGILVSGGFFSAARRSSLRRHWVLGATSIAVGLIVGLLTEGADYAAVSWYFVGMGGLLALTGAIELAAFARHYPVVEP